MWRVRPPLIQHEETAQRYRDSSEVSMSSWHSPLPSLEAGCSHWLSLRNTLVMSVWPQMRSAKQGPASPASCCPLWNLHHTVCNQMRDLPLRMLVIVLTARPTKQKEMLVLANNMRNVQEVKQSELAAPCTRDDTLQRFPLPDSKKSAIAEVAIHYSNKLGILQSGFQSKPARTTPSHFTGSVFVFLGSQIAYIGSESSLLHEICQSEIL